MNLAGFCRNCLSNWLKDAADAAGVALSKEESRDSSTACPTRSGRPVTRARPCRSAPGLREDEAEPLKRFNHNACLRRTDFWPPSAYRMREGEFMDDAAFNTESVAADQLKAFIERIERLEEEKAGIAGDIKDVYAEAKGNGFDTKALRKIVSLRKRDYAERQEEEAILELYMQALGMAG